MSSYGGRKRKAAYAYSKGGAITIKNPLYVASKASMPAYRKKVRRSGYVRKSGFYGRFNQPGGGNELKFFDTSISVAPTSTMAVPATGGQLCLIPQGTTEQQRIGRKCVIKSIQIRGLSKYVPAASTSGNLGCCLYVVLDKQCNGAAAAQTDVFTTSSPNTMMVNLANSDRFVVLKKYSWVAQSAAGIQTAFSNDSDRIEWYHKCNIPLEFSSTTGAITEIKSNNVFLLVGTDGADGANITITGTARLRFSDD